MPNDFPGPNWVPKDLYEELNSDFKEERRHSRSLVAKLDALTHTPGTQWLVTGRSGKWSDVWIWHVRVFATQELAEEFLFRLSTWAEAVGIAWDKMKVHYDDWEDLIEKSTLDPNLRLDDTGVKYAITEVSSGWPAEPETKPEPYIQRDAVPVKGTP